MTIRSGLEINRVTQFQTLLDRFRTHIEDIPDLSGDLSVCHIHLRTAKSIHENIHRFSHTDRIRHLYQHLIRHTGGNHILSDMTSGISSRTVYLRRVLSRESTTAMSTFATVCIHDDLTAGQTGITVRTTDHELTGRVHMINDIIIKQSLYMSRILSLHTRYQYLLHV